MSSNSFFTGLEVISGIGLIIAGVSAQLIGYHGLIAEALIPFGMGLIISECLVRAHKARQDKLRLRAGNDED